MPRRQFMADLHTTQQGALALGVSALQQGEDDGQFEFDYVGPPSQPLPQSVRITALIPDVSDYPKSHEYMIFCGEEAPRQIAAALEDVRGINRKTVFELIDIVAATLNRQALDSDGDTQMPDSQDQGENEDEDEDDIYDSDHEAFDLGPSQPQQPAFAAASMTGNTHKATGKAFRDRIRSDLSATKHAGFKVGHLGHLMDCQNAYVTVSIRMSKLGISEEAMQAWYVDPKDYLILIIQYPNGYRTNEELQACDNLRLPSSLAMRLCASKKYKPTLQQVIHAFTTIKKNERDSISASDLPSAEDEAASEDGSLRDTFISKPLNGFFQERLVPILRYRSAGMDWRGAEGWYEQVARHGARGVDLVPDKFFDDEPPSEALPPFLNADHYRSKGLLHYSFPLLAMQFALRHFVRCTEFCLVCHRSLDTNFEAIKPYVCDQSLCLYQYMTLGFGPSIEHEILTQPYVVDLLISFCYNSAASHKLKDYPDGLALMVPQLDRKMYDAPNSSNGFNYGRQQPQQLKEPGKAPAQLAEYDVGFDRDRLEIIFHNNPGVCPVWRGSWIVVRVKGTTDPPDLHCRVSDVTYFPTITIDEPVTITQAPGGATITDANTSLAPRDKPITPATTPKWAPASFQIYGQEFDALDRWGKNMSICKLLDTLPNVKEMQEWLQKSSYGDFKYWNARISPAALSLLRWIIASNRACIMQVDGSGSGAQDRLSGMKGYMQFRFAMGAPDKEQRFMSEVVNTAHRLNLAYPTIFAWHGSPLYNWHMIIREGLHFKNVDHGRAYGDGVYHAKDAQTSCGYSGSYNYNYGGAAGGCPGQWPSSILRINNALALNELVNAPAEFTSSNPYYVVPQIDWIQTRYLFVQCAPLENSGVTIGEDKEPKLAFKQDPSRTPNGISRNHIVIPASAIKSRIMNESTKRGPEGSKSPLKKLKGMGGKADPVLIDDDDDDDTSSQTTDAEDLEIFFPEADPAPDLLVSAEEVAPTIHRPKGNPTDFLPGTLDFATLPIMPEPEYANPSATKRLMKELQSLARTQETTPLSDLGWYIDIEKIENVYQWIVELHSFHTLSATLPLVADMRKANLTSIVLELRFNKDFPFSPPYVRVIRPHFRCFAQGGGGHVVLGGAMCMELLTNSGWSSVSSMESVLMQIRLAMASEPFARIETGVRGDYGVGEAAEGYLRACASHGWKVPEGFKEMAYGMVPPAKR